MEVKGYRERKAAGLVEMKGVGNRRVNVEMAIFDSGTGRQLPSDFESITADADMVAKILKNNEESLAAAKEQVEDSKAFYADVLAADAEWEAKASKGKEILGKKADK